MKYQKSNSSFESHNIMPKLTQNIFNGMATDAVNPGNQTEKTPLLLI